MAQVTLILRESVPSLGEVGDVVRVKPGFARNYLLPQRKAILATDSRVREVEHLKRVVSDKAAKELVDLGALRDRLAGTSLEVTARVGDEGKLFGSVTVAQIADLLAEKGYEIDRRKIALAEPIKEAGEHTVSIRLHREVSAEIKVTVTAEQ